MRSRRFEAALILASIAHAAFFATMFALDDESIAAAPELIGTRETIVLQPEPEPEPEPEADPEADPEPSREPRAAIAAPKPRVMRRSTNDLLGLDALAARNPNLFGRRGPDRELESALAGVVSIERDAIAELAEIAPREVTKPTAKRVIPIAPVASRQVHLDDLEKSNTAITRLNPGTTRESKIDMPAVRRAIETRIHEARACYDRAAELDPGLFGVVRVAMTISETGAVESLELRDATLENEAFTRCLASAIKTWTFPRPTGTRATVEYPLVFNRS